MCNAYLPAWVVWWANCGSTLSRKHLQNITAEIEDQTSVHPSVSRNEGGLRVGMINYLLRLNVVNVINSGGSFEFLLSLIKSNFKLRVSLGSLNEPENPK